MSGSNINMGIVGGTTTATPELFGTLPFKFLVVLVANLGEPLRDTGLAPQMDPPPPPATRPKQFAPKSTVDMEAARTVGEGSPAKATIPPVGCRVLHKVPKGPKIGIVRSKLERHRL